MEKLLYNQHTFRFHIIKCKTIFIPQAQPFWYRCVFILLWAKFGLYKYVSCWLIAVSSLLIYRYVHKMCLKKCNFALKVKLRASDLVFKIYLIYIQYLQML